MDHEWSALQQDETDKKSLGSLMDEQDSRASSRVNSADPYKSLGISRSSSSVENKSITIKMNDGAFKSKGKSKNETTETNQKLNKANETSGKKIPEKIIMKKESRENLKRQTKPPVISVSNDNESERPTDFTGNPKESLKLKKVNPSFDKKGQEKKEDSDFDFNLQPISEKTVMDTGTASKNGEGEKKKSAVLQGNITNETLQIDKTEHSVHIMSPQVIRVQPLCSDTQPETKNKSIEKKPHQFYCKYKRTLK